jgi:hypothetical protein
LNLLKTYRLNHIKQRGETERDVLQQHVRVRRRDGYVAAEKRQRSMAVELCCVEKHDVIGNYSFKVNRHQSMVFDFVNFSDADVN